MNSRIEGSFLPQNYPAPRQTAPVRTPASQQTVPAQEAQLPQEGQADPAQDSFSSRLKDQLERSHQETDQLLEGLKQAREEVEKHREALKKLKTPVNCGDATMTAYSKLARARSKADVNAAAGYARRQILRLTAALHTSDGQTQEIRAAISQLKKAVGRAGKKRMDLDREALMAKQRKAAAQRRQARKAASLQHELAKKRLSRTFRENAYLHEASISNYMAVHRDLVIEKYRAELSAISGGAESSSAAGMTDAGMTAAAPDMGGISLMA